MSGLHIDFEKIIQFSHFDHLFASDQTIFKKLIPLTTSMESIGESIKRKKEQDIDRHALAEMLHRQYRSNKLEGRESLIDSLKDDKTFVIVSAHQPYLFGGPMYFIYKILSTIKLAEQCKVAYPDYNFIPIFYVGGEDHDLEESNHIRLFQKTVTWNTSQRGPVGRMNTDDISPAIKEVVSILGSATHTEALTAILNEAYLPGQTINEAITKFIHLLLSDYNLLILNADDKQAKERFKNVIASEVLSQTTQSLVKEQQDKLKSIGLKPQAFVRPINFFYISENGRNRIELNGENYSIVGTSMTFTREEMKNEIQSYPEKFSPNVIMRPLYQEFLLPSVAFVGGGGELAYWSDRKLLFEHWKIHFPVLVRRDSMIIIDKGSQKKLDKLGVSIKDLCLNSHELKSKYIKQHSESDLSFDKEIATIQDLIKELQSKVSTIDPTLVAYVGSETNGFVKSLEQIESRVNKAIAHKHETELNQLTNLQQKFFPNNILQERTDSFLGLYSQYGKEFLDKVYEATEPLSFKMKVVMLD